MTTIFKEHRSVDASESCESLTVFWNIVVLGILNKMSNVLEFQEQLFFRIPFTFYSLFFVKRLMPGGNKGS